MKWMGSQDEEDLVEVLWLSGRLAGCFVRSCSAGEVVQVLATQIREIRGPSLQTPETDTSKLHLIDSSGEEVAPWRCLGSFEGPLTVLASRRGRSVLLSGGLDGLLKVWDLDVALSEDAAPDVDIQIHVNFEEAGSASIRDVCVDSYMLFAMTADANGVLRLWDLSVGTCIWTALAWGPTQPATAIAADFSIGRVLCCRRRERDLQLWDFSGTSNHFVVPKLPAAAASVTATTADASGRGGGEKVNEPIALLRGHTGEAGAIAMNGDEALSGSSDKTLRLWGGIKSGIPSCSRVFAGHSGPIEVIRADFLRKKAFSGGCDKNIRCWNLSNGECTAVFEMDQPIAALCVDFDADRLMVSAGHWTKVLNLQTQNVIASLWTGTVQSSVAISADIHKGLLVTADIETLKVFDFEFNLKKDVRHSNYQGSGVSCLALPIIGNTNSVLSQP
eukprot:TRINITY_DN32756_c0_g1_i1.p1 TRINITY_DN32756_c0_g1~~TRINITY_DN32756_c0_g1_i1.p1  ORF type:complete len:446 (-),score=75.43 TRINITY_DN32756_c0_g1_i1:23-1360(-)